MRLKLLLPIFLFTSLAALVTSCSKNSSVVDDWPGIDEMVLKNEAGSQALSSGDSFTLKSTLALPRMGKDVTFTLKSTCRVSASSNAVSAQKEYSKSSSYKDKTAQALTSIPVVELLPEQVLIFPDFFDQCHFSLTAVNDIGSTQTKELKFQRFSFNEKALDFNLVASKNAYTKDNLSKLIVERASNPSFKDSKLTCLAGKRAETTEISKETTQEVRGNQFTLPEPAEGKPVENCVVLAKDDDGKLLISKRIQILNAEPAPLPKVEITRTILDDQTTSLETYYEDSIKSDINLIGFKITGDAQQSERFRMEKGESSDLNVQVISDLEQTSRTFDGSFIHKTYRMNTISTKASYIWSDGKFKSFSINKNFSQNRTMQIIPSFRCTYNTNQSLSEAELGFALSIKAGSPDFNIQKIIENDFTTDVVTTYNLLELAANKVHLSNLPKNQKIIDDRSGLSVLFRNNRVSPNKPLELKSKVRQLVYGKNGEPVAGFENIEQFAFSTRIYPNSISCSSQSDFK